MAENYLTDLRIATLSTPRQQSSRIAVILIDEKSLSEVPYLSPIDRALISKLMGDLEQQSVTAIGLNIRFDRPTEADKDEQLYQRLRAITVPIVISMVSNETGYSSAQIQFSRNYLQGLSTGLSLIYRDSIDHTVRVSMLNLPKNGQDSLGFSATLAAAIGIELPSENQIHIDYRHGPDKWTPPFPVYSASEVHNLPKSALENRIVLIGTDLGHVGRLRTPLSVLNNAYTGGLPGVMIEAHVLSQLIENRNLKVTNEYEKLALTIIMVIIGYLFSMLRANLLVKILTPLVLLPIVWLGALLFFLLDGSIVPIVTPTIAFVVAIVIGSFWQWRQETLRREKVHHAFGQFMAPTVVEKILQNPGELKLSGEVREISFLFTDLEDFTSLTESTPPEVMVNLVNHYLEEACEIVMDHGGTIDKIVGDALHVMFNAPLKQDDHAQRAVRCALALEHWSEGFRVQQRGLGINLGVTRIGVNTGDCVVGNFGGKKRFDYTAYGDTINSAARLEAINKRLGTTICVSESTVLQCQGIYFRSVATLILQGKTKGIRAYMPIAEQKVYDTHTILYEQAYRLLSEKDPGSKSLFTELATQYPQDPLISLHTSRIEEGEDDTTITILTK